MTEWYIFAFSKIIISKVGLFIVRAIFKVNLRKIMAKLYSRVLPSFLCLSYGAELIRFCAYYIDEQNAIHKIYRDNPYVVQIQLSSTFDLYLNRLVRATVRSNKN
ncbi:hypothetical protein T4D_10824 [Trichinella pseudospiralis]|uniref:Uncharacterized protein n=1 Tax=Trichinella pseudospiralis TaxID=6337 RepID=A0A0V1FIP5_TRIPS|nr:hypothetical protein T4D_10824 [Trichinella pseudospiralis]